MKIKNIVWMMAVGWLLGACAEDDSVQGGRDVPIALTSQMEQEQLLSGDGISRPATTRAIQETQLASGETVYLWADKGTAGTYAYLKAWQLTANGSGGLTPANTKYYPADGSTLTVRAVHGNFSSVPSEGTTIGSLTHSVIADQSAAGAYEHSDLLYAETSGDYTTDPLALPFSHKMAKIEVNISAGPGIDPSLMSSVVVKVRNVLPSVSINVSNGSVGAATGSPITITARRTGTLFEAVLPPQSAPSGVITITYNGQTSYVPNAINTFAANTKYIYNISLTNKDKRLNPLWYVAENNVQSYNYGTKVVTLETNPEVSTTKAGWTYGYCYTWEDAMAYFAKQATSYDTYWAGDITDGSTGFRYHLPCQKEWLSIIPSNDNLFPDAGASASSEAQTCTCIFGYNSTTKSGITDSYYLSSYTASSNTRYAIRFLGTQYCSVWKYKLSGSVLTVTAKLVEPVAAGDATTKLNEYISKDDAWWNANDEDKGSIQRKFYMVGNVKNINGSDAGGTGNADSDRGSMGHYNSATASSETLAYGSHFNTNRMCILAGQKKYGLSVRLFRTEGVSESRVADPGVALSSSSIKAGWVIADNNKAYSYSALAQAYNHKPLALIYATGASASGNSNYTHGIAISLSNGTSSKWGTSREITCTPQSNVFSTAKGYMDGVTYTATLVSHGSHGHDAAVVANNFNTTYAISGAKWFLPSLGQWCEFIKWCNGSFSNSDWRQNNSSYRSKVTIKIAAAKGSALSGYYWTSVEYMTHSAVYVNFSSDNIELYAGYKDNGGNVRPFLAY